MLCHELIVLELMMQASCCPLGRRVKSGVVVGGMPPMHWVNMHACSFGCYFDRTEIYLTGVK